MKPTEKSRFTLMEMLITLAILFIMAAMCFGMLGNCNKSTGVRAGTLQKFSYKGFIHSSYEGELLLGGITVSSDGRTSANVWEFSVLDTTVANQLNNLVGKPVLLYYHQNGFYNPAMRDTAYVVDSVSTNSN